MKDLECKAFDYNDDLKYGSICTATSKEKASKSQKWEVCTIAGIYIAAVDQITWFQSN